MAPLKSQIDWCTRMQLCLLGGILVVGAIFYVGGYRPQNARMAQLQAEMATARNDLSANTARAQGLAAVAADILRLRAQLADFKTLPTNLELGEFVTEITQLSRRANLHKLEYSLSGAPRPGKQYNEQAMTLKFDGDFRDVFAFLRRAEDLQRLTRVSSITIHDVDLLSGSVRVDLSMNLYFSEG
ncbi:MAG: type 4a pilus biogenesis protein PilO [Tepidisphaeraceae bacterium]|jgi:Tfp pilus assembly protein PilO